MRLLVIAGAFFLVFWHWFDPAVIKARQGLKFYNEKKWNMALSAFLSAKNIARESGEIQFNIGTVLFRQQKFNQAAEEFQGALRNIGSRFRGSTHFNSGICFFMEKDYRRAAQSFRKALLYDPGDGDARINLELTLQMLENQERPPESETEEMSKEKQHQPLMDYLNQNEKEMQKKKSRPTEFTQNEKDW